mgnify:FL=1
MRALNRFGEWCLRDGWWYLVMVILMSAALYAYSLPKTVTINEQEWECATPGTKGIDAVCLVYRHKSIKP